MKFIMAAVLAFATLPVQAELNWEAALNGPQRSQESKARDSSRHPQETLEFFGLREGMTVLEVAPGGGWYTEVIAPMVSDSGAYYAAHYGMNGPSAYYRASLGKYLQKLAADKDNYGAVIVTQLQPPLEIEAAPAATVDLAVAFRNVHSWMRADALEPTLAAIYKALKPGASFGLVQHRAKPETPVETMKTSGYVTEAYVIAAVEAAGFTLEASSDINANPRDTADHPKGVWTLPPALRLGDVDRAKYDAIGESDRMTLKFIKPGT